MLERVTKKVVIDPYRGGDDIGSSTDSITEKDYNLDISKYIFERLQTLGIPVSITRDADKTIDIDSRVELIKSFYGTGSDVIVISNALSSESDGAEVIYALRNSSTLASEIASEIEKTGMEVDKYYQRRLPSDTAKDYNQLIRDTENNESLIIYYGNINDNEDFLEENMEALGEAVVIALADYLGVSYTPLSGSNYYVVKSGDSLYSIAKKYNTTVSELQSLNNLSSTVLSIGEVLKIPTSDDEVITEDVVTYTVKSGDTFFMKNKFYEEKVS